MEQNHLITSAPYCMPIKYNYKLRILVADESYAKALFNVAKNNTAQSQSFHNAEYGRQLARYNTDKDNQYRIAYKTA